MNPPNKYCSPNSDRQSKYCIHTYTICQLPLWLASLLKTSHTFSSGLPADTVRYRGRPDTLRTAHWTIVTRDEAKVLWASQNDIYSWEIKRFVFVFHGSVLLAPQTTLQMINDIMIYRNSDPMVLKWYFTRTPSRCQRREWCRPSAGTAESSCRDNNPQPAVGVQRAHLSPLITCLVCYTSSTLTYCITKSWWNQLKLAGADIGLVKQ